MCIVCLGVAWRTTAASPFSDRCRSRGVSIRLIVQYLVSLNDLNELHAALSESRDLARMQPASFTVVPKAKTWSMLSACVDVVA